MRVLVACEFSGIVRDAFLEEGHQALSCDLMDSEAPGPHVIGDVRDLLDKDWDLMIAHPPCTFLCNSGVQYLYTNGGTLDEYRCADAKAGADFFKTLLNAPISRIAVENPVMHDLAATWVGIKPTQTIQPYQFGHHESKATCLWLKGLQPLQPTEVVDGRSARIATMSPSPTRWMDRSRTYYGVARAMAKQWGNGCASP